MRSAKNALWILGLTLFGPALAQGQTTADLDAYWTEVGRTVSEGDFQAYADLYHTDAVLVALGSGTSYSIAQALDGWEPGFADTRSGNAQAGVSFRLTQRLNDETTAHETGIFRYTFKPAGGAETVSFVHFEALLVRANGTWLMMMEYQKLPATEAEWNAAR